jgi:pyruvate ferredoxin oxidoreductase alpha subunit
MASTERRAKGTDQASALLALLLDVEKLTSDVVVQAIDGMTPAGAVGAATVAALAGQRAAVVLESDELFEALGAIHAAARARAPFVIHVVDRAGAGPALGRDELAPALDLGAGVLASWSPESAVDLALAARRAAEDSETPWLVVSEGLSGIGSVKVPERALITQFLGEARVDAPRSGAPEAADEQISAKRAERSYASRAPFALASSLRQLGELTGRPLHAVERHAAADAEEVIVAFGAGYVVACAVADKLRAEGRRVGAVGVRSLRPFFGAEAVKAAARARAIAVIEPLDVALAPSGPLATSFKAAFADALTWAAGFPGVGRIPPIVSAVFATLDGGVRERDVRAIVDELRNGDRARRVLVFGSDAP